MHEFSIAQSIVSALEMEIGAMAQRPGKVLEVSVVLGKMHQVVIESLQMAWEALSSDSPVLEGSSLVIKTRPVVLLCRSCGKASEKGGLLFVCPACGARDVEITGGREFFIEEMKVEKND